MAHKDPITGVMVADIGEVFSSEELEQIFVDMDEDDRRVEKELMESSETIEKMFLECLREQEYLGDSECTDVKIMKIWSVKEVSVSTHIKESRIKILADISVKVGSRFVRGIMMYNGWDWSGSFYEPPDRDCSLEWVVGDVGGDVVK